MGMKWDKGVWRSEKEIRDMEKDALTLRITMFIVGLVCCILLLLLGNIGIILSGILLILFLIEFWKIALTITILIFLLWLGNVFFPTKPKINNNNNNNTSQINVERCC